MTSRDFCYWLQGFLEIEAAGADKAIAMTGNGAPLLLSPGQLDCVKRHLALVFKHEIDPSAGSALHQDALNKLHNPPSGNGPTFRC